MSSRVLKRLCDVALRGDSNDLIFRQNGRVLSELQAIYIWMAKFENCCHIPYVPQMAVTQAQCKAVHPICKAEMFIHLNTVSTNMLHWKQTQTLAILVFLWWEG